VVEPGENVREEARMSKKRKGLKAGYQRAGWWGLGGAKGEQSSRSCRGGSAAKKEIKNSESRTINSRASPGG